jgi:hypothetical protein
MTTPEEAMIVSVGDKLISGKPLYDAVRHIRDKLQLVSMGIEDITPSDRFVMYFFSEHVYSGGGTLTRFPKDILAFQERCREARQKD